MCVNGLLCKKAKDADESGEKGYAMPINALCVCTMDKEDVDNCIVFAKTKQKEALAYCCIIDESRAKQRYESRPTKNYPTKLFLLAPMSHCCGRCCDVERHI